MSETSDFDVTTLYENKDDTLGCILREELLQNPNVTFAGYKVPHPLHKSVQVRVCSINEPVKEIVDNSFKNIINNVDIFEKAFTKALKAK